MFLRPLLRVHSYPTTISSIRNTRYTRPSVKISKERFELTLDLRNFNKDEISVKALPKYVIIEGKKERKTTQGSVMSQFIKKYKLPEGCKIKDMESKLTPEGVLTVSAPRACCEPDISNIVVVPIRTAESEKNKVVAKLDAPKPKVYANPCNAYFKVKPKPPKT